jgi:hypothetical protein
VNTDGDFKTSQLRIGLPLVWNDKAFICKYMIDDFFTSPKTAYGLNSLQSVGQAYRALAFCVRQLIEKGELKLLITKNFDDCSTNKSIDLLYALSTIPDYSYYRRRQCAHEVRVDIENTAAEYMIDFRSRDGSTVPLTIVLGAPWLMDSHWHCSYFIEGLMVRPFTVCSNQSLTALCLGIRDIYNLLDVKSHEGVLYARSYDNARTLEEFKLRNYFHRQN